LTPGSYSYGFFALVIVPLIPFLISLLAFLLARFWANSIKSREVLGFHLGFMCKTPEQANNYLHACLKQSVPFLGVVYNNVCLQAFGTFSCQTLRDGTAVMNAGASMCPMSATVCTG
jgi:hypothetical protein